MASVEGMQSLRDQLRDSNLDQAKQSLAKVWQYLDICTIFSYKFFYVSFHFYVYMHRFIYL